VYRGTRVLVALLCERHEGSLPETPAGLFSGSGRR
jgi:hypothetical protein